MPPTPLTGEVACCFPSPTCPNQSEPQHQILSLDPIAQAWLIPTPTDRAPETPFTTTGTFDDGYAP